MLHVHSVPFELGFLARFRFDLLAHVVCSQLLRQRRCVPTAGARDHATGAHAVNGASTLLVRQLEGERSDMKLLHVFG